VTGRRQKRRLRKSGIGRELAERPVETMAMLRRTLEEAEARESASPETLRKLRDEVERLEARYGKAPNDLVAGAVRLAKQRT
jgi:hypothetical protein